MESYVAVAHEQFGDHLRSVLVYRVENTSVRSEVCYVRDDIAAAVDDVEGFAASFAEDYGLEIMEQGYQESLRRLGGLRATMRVFTEAVIIRVLFPEAALAVSVDSDALPVLDGFLDAIGTTDLS